MNPSPAANIPHGPLMAVTIALHTLISTDGDEGPAALPFLRNEPKALVIPWFGNITRDPQDFDEERDGKPIIARPNNAALVRLPHESYGRNILMGVPTWLVSAPSRQALRLGTDTTVIAVGMYYPVLTNLRLDLYLDGRLRGRRWCHRPDAPREDLMSNSRFQIMAAGWDADLGPAPEATPAFEHRMLW